SKTESIRLCHVHPKLSQSDSIASESTLSRDQTGQSLPRASRHSTQTLISTLSHNLTLCVLERINLGRVRRLKTHLSNWRHCRGHNCEPLHAFDPEIERTLHRLRKARRTITLDSSSSNSIGNSKISNFTTNDCNLFEHQEIGSMENNDRILKELATPDVVCQPWCIQCPPLEPAQSYELRSSLIHLLLKFHGLAGEDPHKHLKEFHMGIPKDHIKMKVFPFSLDGGSKDWLYLQPVLFNTWGDMKRMFLEKFFLVSRTATIRKEICGIRQHFGETLHEYWDRFNKLCATCPHHQINE
ncbi:hypothetical protein CR513_60327, partial [Mucuna pruriens]